MKKIVPGKEFRRRARLAMKPVMGVLLVVAMIAALPSILDSVIIMITQADPTTVVTDSLNRMLMVMEEHGLQSTGVTEELLLDEAALAALEADLVAVTDGYLQDLNAFFVEKGPIMLGSMLMVLVFGPVLTLGLINAMLHALRKKEFTYGIILSRLNCFFRVLGMQLLVILKTLLWMLPGIAVMLASMLAPLEVMGLMMLAGLAGAMVPGIMASYRYAMSVYVMADAPETPVLDCIRRSKEIMHRRKGELFLLELSFFGWTLLLSYVRAFLNGFGPVIGLTLGMFAALFLTVYTNCAKAAFYQEYGVGPLQAEEAPQAEEQDLPADDELN